MSKHNRHTVARLVQDRIRDCHPEGLTFEVDEQAIVRINGQWRIPIHPSREPEKLYEYYEALTEVEIDLEESEDLNVFLAPSDPKSPSVVETGPQGDENRAGLNRPVHKPKRRLQVTKQV